MNFEEVSCILNDLLRQSNPIAFGGSWIRRQAPRIYRFIRKHLRTATGEIDWDTITRKLDRPFQRRWVARTRIRAAYEDRNEIDLVINKYRSQLYVFIAPLNGGDKQLCDTISIALVRLAQKGNMFAREEILMLVRNTVDQWIEFDPQLRRWRGYESELPAQIEGCIRRYRYSGTFIGYLYRTLECASRGLPPPTTSLDTEILDGKKCLIDNVVQDAETGEIRLYPIGR
jgi:hypothetical protein